MTSLHEAAEASLDALKEMRQKYGEYDCQACDHADVAIIKLCAALAEPVQEPVVWMSKEDIENPSGWRTVYLHTSAMATENSVPLYTDPHQRRPLTDEEINALELPPSGTATARDLVRLIERAHGIGGQP